MFMKKQLLFLPLLTILFMFFTKPSSAAIIQGNAVSNTSVTTNIQGSGEVHTYIKSTVNGVTKVVEGDQPGTYTLNNSSDIKATTTPSITPTKSATPTATITPKPTPKSFLYPIIHLREFFQNLFKMIFPFFNK